MLNNTDLFSVLEICSAALDRHRETILHYSMALVLMRKNAEVDLFHFQPLAFIGKFLRDSPGCKLIIPNTLMNSPAFASL